MNRLTDNKIILVTRPTRLAELVIRFNTVSQARFYVEHQGADFSDYVREDETYHLALREAETPRPRRPDRNHLPRGALSGIATDVARLFKACSPARQGSASAFSGGLQRRCDRGRAQPRRASGRSPGERNR